ncbi:MAG TPA: GDSL-type esterase/lipase family protein [Nitrospiraceae bacterium]|nr:GDSL-type esterase/lipase family protein [Nitrospiraceae bacterium]
MMIAVNHIVCFGDSLTAGFQSPTADNPLGVETPYGQFLQELIGPAGRVSISGICGELTGEMAMRFRSAVLNHQPTHVVILGGTNDLGWNALPADIMRNLLKMYELAAAAGIQPVPVTVPSIRVGDDLRSAEGRRWFAEHLDRRCELNGSILRYAASKRLAAFDLFAATAEPETQQLAAEYSNDGLHLTTAGYRLIAERLHQEIFAAGPVSGS